MPQTSTNPNQQQISVPTDAKLSSARKVFEEKAPELLQGQLWRYLLNASMSSGGFLSGYVKSHFGDELAHTVEGAVITVSELSLQPLINRVQQTFKTNAHQNTQNAWKQRKQKYLDQLNANAIFRQALYLNNTLANQLRSEKIERNQQQPISQAELLQGYVETFYCSLANYDTYELVAESITAEQFKKLLEFLEKAAKLETALTDLLLLNRFTRIHYGPLKFLVNTTISQHISNDVLLMLLDMCSDTLIALLKHEHVQAPMQPRELLDKLTKEDWKLCIKYQLGLERTPYVFLVAIASGELPLFAERLGWTDDELIALAELAGILRNNNPSHDYYAYRPLVLPLLSYPGMIERLGDRAFIKITRHLDNQYMNMLIEGHSGKSFLARLIAIISHEKTRREILNDLGLNSSIFKEAVATHPKILQLLPTELFIEVTSCLSHFQFMKLLSEGLEFYERVLTLSATQLIIMSKKAGFVRNFVEVYIKRAELLEKFTSDDELIQIIRNFTFAEINQIRHEQKKLDERLTGDVLFKLVLISSFDLADALPNEPDLLVRLNKEQVYTLLTCSEMTYEVNLANDILIKSGYARELSRDQVITIKLLFDVYSLTLNIIEEEIDRRNIRSEIEKCYLAQIVPTPVLKRVDSNDEEDQQESEDYDDDYSEEDNIEDDRESFINDSVFEDKIEESEKGTECQYCHHGIAPEPQPEIYRIKPKPPSHIRQALNAIWDSRSLFYCLLGVGFAATCFLIGWTLPTFILGGILAAGLAFETVVLMYKLASYYLNTRNKRIDIELQQDSSALFSSESVYNPRAKFSEQQVAHTLLKQQPTSVLPNTRSTSTLPI